MPIPPCNSLSSIKKRWALGWFLPPLIIAFWLPQPLRAQQVLKLASFNSQQTDVKLYHSFKHSQIVVALIAKPSDSFRCEPNRFIFYNYEKERFSEISAGDLALNGDFSTLFFSKIRIIDSSLLSPAAQKKELEQLALELKIPATTLSGHATKSGAGKLLCWQQATLRDLISDKEKDLPYLLGNLCVHSWCNDFYWEQPNQMRFWSALEPDWFHLLSLNSDTKHTTFHKNVKVFQKKNPDHDVVPRENLLQERGLKEYRRILTKKSGEAILLFITTEKEQTQITLQRNSSDKQRVAALASEINAALEANLPALAMEKIRFSQWFDPQNIGTKRQRLRLLALMQQAGEIFQSLKQDFSDAERLDTCKEIHLDPIYRSLWKRATFQQQFKSVCP